MKEEQLKLLANGIASIAEAVDFNFWEVLDALQEGSVLSEEEKSDVKYYMETL